ncbi:MAG: DUF5906 domain-containing protein [Pseudomonas sp.]
MQVLPAALQPLAAFDQFVNWNSWPDPDTPGKTIKTTVHPVTGKAHNAHDPAIWMSAAAALATGRPVGFVFTEADPFFFLDIDDALVGGQWSDTAQGLCSQFAGCAVEVSQSGTGLHIIGTGTVPPHGCDSKPLKSQFYTSRRFVALTGVHAQGDASRDATPALRRLVVDHFPPTRASDPDHWQEGPVEGWRGPESDEELVRRALRSTSTAAIFGGGVTFAQLWQADAEALAAKWPGDREAYNASEADAALASHLAFWTGCDMPRMDTLMRQSALMREKWDHRPDYLPRTFARVCTPGRAVCVDAVPEPAAGAEPETPKAFPRGTLMDGEKMARLFDGCHYIRSRHQVMLPSGKIVGPEPFNVEFGGYTFMMKESTDGAGAFSDLAFKAFTQSARFQCSIVDAPVFAPERPPREVFEEDRMTLINNYVPLHVPRVAGNVEPFLAHLRNILPVEKDRLILLAWMAAVVQHPGVKFLWSPVVIGDKGAGKSILFEKLLTAAVGKRYCNTIKPAQMNAKHNTWMLDHVFSLCDDVGKHVSDEWLDDVKTIITGRRQMVEPKGVDAYMTDVCTNLAFTGNHRRSIRVSPDERRFAILWCAVLPEAATQAFTSWTDTPANVQAVSHLLGTMAIPAAYNPVVVRNAPWTSSMEEAISKSGDNIDQMIEDAISEGAAGFRGDLISMQALEGLLAAKGLARLSRSVREEALERMGYGTHPQLRNGWTNNRVQDKKLRIFVRRGSEAEGLPTAAAVSNAFIKAQEIAPGEIAFGGGAQAAG